MSTNDNDIDNPNHLAKCLADWDYTLDESLQSLVGLPTYSHTAPFTKADNCSDIIVVTPEVVAAQKALLDPFGPTSTTQLLGSLFSTTSSAITAQLSQMPKEMTYYTGHGHAKSHTIHFTEEDWSYILSAFESAPQNAGDERKKIGACVANFEKKVQEKAFSRNVPLDKGGWHGNVEYEIALSFFGISPDWSLDCVDESANTQWLLTALSEHSIFKFHTASANNIVRVDAGGVFHEAARVQEMSTKKDYVVDSWWKDIGDVPQVIQIDSWKAATITELTITSTAENQPTQELEIQDFLTAVLLEKITRIYGKYVPKDKRKVEHHYLTFTDITVLDLKHDGLDEGDIKHFYKTKMPVVENIMRASNETYTKPVNVSPNLAQNVTDFLARIKS